MAKIEFHAYKVHEVTKYHSSVTGKEETLVSISLGLGAGEPFPTETIEAKRVADIEPAFAAYIERAKASGLQLQVPARVKDGRSPAGFKDRRWRAEVNV